MLHLWIEAVYEQLLGYEQKIFGGITDSNLTIPTFPSGVPSFSFGFPKPQSVSAHVPAFSSSGAPSIFARPAFDGGAPQEFTFGAGQTQANTSGNIFDTQAAPNPNSNDIPMGGLWDVVWVSDYVP